MTQTTRKSVRGWGLSLSLLLFKRRITLSIMPLVFNPLLVVRGKANSMVAGSFHAVFACFHMWSMEADTLVGFEVDVDYNYFWYDRPRLPPNGFELLAGGRP